MTVPGVPLVQSGAYRLMAHPNYAGVALEIAALPVIHGAWITSVVFSAFNALVLWRRVTAEEAALGIRRPATSLRTAHPLKR